MKNTLLLELKNHQKKFTTKIRYDDNQKVDFWYFQVDDFLEKNERTNYNVLRFAIENGTWSFPPVIIENTLANQIGKQNFGNPIHLIEGTHRVSFINRLYELNFIKSDTEHELLCVVKR